jgi:hypothetical protein
MTTKTKKQITLYTSLGDWKVVKTSSYQLKFHNVQTNEKFNLISAPGFKADSVSSLLALAESGHKFPSVHQYQILEHLYYNGLREWFTNENINFAFSFTTFITNETLTTTMENPYGNDFLFTKVVCYDMSSSQIKLLDEKDKVRYMLTKLSRLKK